MGTTQGSVTRLYRAQSAEANMTLSHAPTRPSLAPTVKVMTIHAQKGKSYADCLKQHWNTSWILTRENQAIAGYKISQQKLNY
jgi:hypothetical protein